MHEFFFTFGVVAAFVVVTVAICGSITWFTGHSDRHDDLDRSIERINGRVERLDDLYDQMRREKAKPAAKKTTR